MLMTGVVWILAGWVWQPGGKWSICPDGDKSYLKFWPREISYCMGYEIIETGQQGGRAVPMLRSVGWALEYVRKDCSRITVNAADLKTIIIKLTPSFSVFGSRNNSQTMMRVINIPKYGRAPILAQAPLPVRKPSQLLIKMKYAPINPSDLNFYLGLYGIRKEGFVVMGFEGSGVVQESDDPGQVGQRVSLLANMHNGTYSEYVVSGANEVIFWPKGGENGISEQEMSMFCVNPLSLMGMANIPLHNKASSVVVSAAASSMGRAIAGFFTKRQPGIQLYGLTRNSAQDDELKQLGYRKIYRMDDAASLRGDLKGKSVFLDCIGGNFGGQVLNALPPNSIMVNYGRLSKERLGDVDLAELYYRNKGIRGFWLNNYLADVSEGELQDIKQTIVQEAGLFKQKVRKVYPMEQISEAMRESIKDQSAGKILLSMQ